MREPVISLKIAVKALDLRVAGPGSDPVATDQPSTNILCPECSKRHSGGRRTFNLNFEKNVFGCPRCHFSGGVYALISYYTGWEISEVEKRIKNGELKGAVACRQEETSIPRCHVMAPIQRRHLVYSALLEQLSLQEEHRKDLLRRGLTEDDISRIGFKSLPKYMDMTVIPKKLINAGYDLQGVPGFGLTQAGTWALAKAPDGGYLIPLKNGAGLIQGFQIRFDHPSKSIPKYGYFSSKHMDRGTECEGWISWAGNRLRKGEVFDILLTEGSLKGYITHARTGVNVIAVPGVAVLKKVPDTLNEMKNWGLRKVVIAYDMDADTNEDVCKQLNRLRDMLDEIHIKHATLRWDPKIGKGVDDWLVNH